MECCQTIYCCTDNQSTHENTYGRKFLTKEERTQMLQKYSDWLEKEAQGVKEAIEIINK